MDDLEFKSKILLGMYGTSVFSWFLVPENQSTMIFMVSMIVSIFAIWSYVARIRRDNSQRKINEYKHLNEEINKNEEKPD